MNLKKICNKESDWDSLGKFSWCESVANMKLLDLIFGIPPNFFLFSASSHH